MVEVKVPLLQRNLALYEKLLNTIGPDAFVVKNARIKTTLTPEEKEKIEMKKAGFVEITKISWTTLDSEELEGIKKKLEEKIKNLEEDINKKRVDREEGEFRLKEMKIRLENVNKILEVRKEFTELIKELQGLSREDKSMKIIKWAKDRKLKTLLEKEWKKHRQEYTEHNVKKLIYKYAKFNPVESALRID
jgi:hypothetical protein